MMDTSTLQAMLAETPYRELVRSMPRASDPLIFFSGCEPNAEIFDQGWAIFRSVWVGSRRQSFEEFLTTLTQAPERSVFTLRANTGEGKTTFLRQLAWRLQSERVVLQWHDFARHSPAVLHDLVNAGYPLLVVAEVNPQYAEKLRAIGGSLSSDPLPCALLMCGTANDLARAEFRGKQQVAFTPLNDAEVSQLVRNLRKAFQRSSADAITERVPGLPLFFDELDTSVLLTDPRFSNPSTAEFSADPLFVGLLKATYGTDFRSRLADEYRRLGERSSRAQTLYRLACYCDSVGYSVPATLLLRIFERDEVRDIFSQYGKGAPLVAANGRVSTRHRFIAETVLLESKLLDETNFNQFVAQLFSPAPTDSEYIRIVGQILGEYASWEPLDASWQPRERGQIRRAIRKNLLERRQWIGRAQTTTAAARNDTTAYEWAALMYHVLPESQRDAAAANLMDLQRSWLKVAEPLASGSARRQIVFWKSRAALIEAQAGGQGAEIAEDVALKTWRALLREPGPGLRVDFYVALAKLAFKRIRDLPARNDSETRETADLYKDAVVAAEHAVALTGRSNESVGALYAEMLSRAHGKPFNQEQLLAIWWTAWNTSQKLECPNPQTGCGLAELLIQAGDQEGARRVLMKILAGAVWGDALLLLAKVGESDTATQDYVKAYVDDRRSQFDIISPLNVALMQQALARMARYRKDEQAEIAALESACAQYKLAIDSVDRKRRWEQHGVTHWKDAVTRLKALSAPSGSECEAVWKDVASRFLTADRPGVGRGQH